MPDETRLTGVRNFRDLGGLPTADGTGRVRHGRLFRSGHLAAATAEDVAVLDGLGLRLILDLRHHVDISLDGPDVPLRGVRHLNMPLSDPASGAEFWAIVQSGRLDELRRALGDGRAEHRMRDSYRRIVTERTAEHGRMLRLLAEPDGVPALIHCTAGKDRAGWSAAVVLLALGVRWDAIERDYLASSAAHRLYRFRRADGSVPDPDSEIATLVAPLFDARLSYLHAAVDEVRRNWGSEERYLTEGLGCGPDMRERLRETLLTTVDGGAPA
ncbi:tyrosine-protein phosphatase [Allostreptomyces psammosilenae]|nr:tyrosine-protein phosphatase [Allostreptomyces psammosilenae]